MANLLAPHKYSRVSLRYEKRYEILFCKHVHTFCFMTHAYQFFISCFSVCIATVQEGYLSTMPNFSFDKDAGIPMKHFTVMLREMSKCGESMTFGVLLKNSLLYIYFFLALAVACPLVRVPNILKLMAVCRSRTANQFGGLPRGLRPGEFGRSSRIPRGSVRA